MSISDADFASFLLDDGERKVLLAEIDAIYSAGPDAENVPAKTTIRLADYPYNTEPSEAPGGLGGYMYDDCIGATPAFSQSIDTTALGGKTSYSIGQLEITNSDGRFDGLLNRITDGQECRLYLGAKTWARADFRNVLTAIVQRVTAPAQDKIVFELRDRGLLLNTDLVGAAVGGTGPNAGHPLPIILGFCNNVEAVLIDATTLKYGISDVAGPQPITVYDSGFQLSVESPLVSALGSTYTVDAGADTIRQADLNLSVDDILLFEFSTSSMGIVAGNPYFVVSVDPVTGAFAISPTRGGSPLDLTGSFDAGDTIEVDRYPSLDNGDGTITLAHPPAGRVTVNVDARIGDTGSPSDASRGSAIIHELAVNRGGVPSGNFSGPLPSFAVDQDDCDFHLGRPTVARENLTGVLDDVLFSLNGFWGFDQFSDLIYGRIRPQDIGSWLGSPDGIMDLGSDDVVDLTSLSLEHLPPTYKDARGYFQKSWTDQTDGFAGGVELDRISYLQNGGLFFKDEETDPFTEGYSVNPSRYHKTMVSSPDYQTLLSQQTCGLAFAEFQTWLHDRRVMLQPYLELLRLKTNLRFYGLKLGDVVRVTLDRFGYDDGVLTQVVGIDTDLTAQTIGLILLCRKVPDTVSGFISFP